MDRNHGSQKIRVSKGVATRSTSIPREPAGEAATP
jgi:hypothetical protein